MASKFKVGDIVNHKLNTKKIVIIKVNLKLFWKEERSYLCSYGENPEIVKGSGSDDYLDYYEGELELKDALQKDGE